MLLLELEPLSHSLAESPSLTNKMSAIGLDCCLLVVPNDKPISSVSESAAMLATTPQEPHNFVQTDYSPQFCASVHSRSHKLLVQHNYFSESKKGMDADF